MAKVKNLKIKEKAFGIIADGSLFMSGFSLYKGISSDKSINYIIAGGLGITGGIMSYQEHKAKNNIDDSYGPLPKKFNDSTNVMGLNNSYNCLRVCTNAFAITGGYLLCRDGFSSNIIPIASMYIGMLAINEVIKYKTKKLIKEGNKNE